MSSDMTKAEQKFFRAMDKKAALSEVEKLRKATLAKTKKLRELRLAKEEADKLLEADKPKKPKRKARAKKRVRT